MMNIDTGYMVLSVKEIRRMLRAAQASRKAASATLGHDTGDKHCIVLEGLRIVPNSQIKPADPASDGRYQVTSTSVSAAVGKVVAKAERA